MVEREALKLAVQRPALCGPEFDALGADAFTAPVHGAVFTLIAACGGTAAGGSSAREWVARLREAAPNERAQAFVTALAVEPLQIDAANQTPSTRTSCSPRWASSPSAGRSPRSRPGCSA